MDESSAAKWILEEEDFTFSLANIIPPTPESHTPTDPTFEFPSIFEFSSSGSKAGQSSPKFPTYLFVYSNLNLNHQPQITSQKKFVALSKSSSTNTSSRSYNRNSSSGSSSSNSSNNRSNSTSRRSLMLSRRLSVQLIGPARFEAGAILSVGNALRRRVRCDGGGGNETKEEKKEGKWVKKLMGSLALRCLQCHALEPICQKPIN